MIFTGFESEIERINLSSPSVDCEPNNNCEENNCEENTMDRSDKIPRYHVIKKYMTPGHDILLGQVIFRAVKPQTFKMNWFLLQIQLLNVPLA